MALTSLLIQPSDIVEIVFSRNIQNLHFKEDEIRTAQYLYVSKILGEDFVTHVAANTDDFEDLLTGYVAPVIAYGVVVTNFFRVATEITDRGINVFQNTGSQQADSETKNRLFTELNNTLNVKISAMVEFCQDQSALLVVGYEHLLIDDNYVDFHEVAVFGKALKNTYL